ncbi:MAG: hypothetical protein D6679_02685 [Candidatus Hydrogenedentota bacterium]|nr:MAG: hypothetical protein D6679_02685 [Candidatus Hydrogenedentota bacterium]
MSHTVRNLPPPFSLDTPILILDPSPFHSEVLLRLLQNAGFSRTRTLASPDGFPAETDQDSLLFLDADAWSEMPEKTSRSRVVVTGSEKKPETLAEALRIGAGSFLTRPYTAGNLQTALLDIALLREVEGSAEPRKCR